MWPQAREAAERAIYANAQLSEAQHVSGQVRWFYDWDFRAADAAFRTAVQLDPSNGENWRLYAHAYNGLVKNLKPSPVRQTGAKGAKPTAAPAARSNPAVDAQVKQYNDSTVKYFEMAEKMPVRVEFTEWTNTAEKSTVAGTVHNKGTAAKAYTMTMEFLDKTGNVVDTQTVSVTEVAPNAKGRFSATSSKPGVVGFRYKPLT